MKKQDIILSAITIFIGAIISIYSLDIRTYLTSILAPVMTNSFQINPKFFRAVFIFAFSYLIISSVFKRLVLLLFSGVYFYEKNTLQNSDVLVNKHLHSLASNEKIILLCATGYFTFAHIDNSNGNTAPLYSLFKNHSGEILVMLLNPESDACQNRAKSIGRNYNEYKEEIYKSINFLKSLYPENNNIKLKLYCQKPVIKIVGTNSRLWIQNYENTCDICHSPVFGIKRNSLDLSANNLIFKLFKPKVTHSLFPFIKDIFYKKWTSDIGITISLSDSDESIKTHILKMTEENRPLSKKYDGSNNLTPSTYTY